MEKYTRHNNNTMSVPPATMAAPPVIPVPLSQNMLGKPPEFDGTEQGWQGYKFVIESYIGALDIDMYDELRISETSAA